MRKPHRRWPHLREGNNKRRMQVRIFTLSLRPSEEELELLNKFLRSNRILQLTKTYSPERGGEWSVFVEYMEGDYLDAAPTRKNSNKDYSKELSPAEYERFASYRAIRKRISEERKVPPYLIFTNEELATLSKFETLTLEMLEGIKDIPARRLKEFGIYLIEDGKKNEMSDESDMPF